MEQSVGLDYFVPGVVAIPRDHLGTATSWSSHEANPAAITEYVRYFLSLPPMSMSTEICIKLNLSGRCLRHLHLSLRAILDVKTVSLTPGHYALGRWIPPQHSAKRAVSMPVLYAGEDQQRWKEMVAHIHVIDAVVEWLDGVYWRDRIPLQSHEMPSFHFLLRQYPSAADETEDDVDFAEFDSLATDVSYFDVAYSSMVTV